MICKVCKEEKTNFVYNADRNQVTDVCAECGKKRLEKYGVNTDDGNTETTA